MNSIFRKYREMTFEQKTLIKTVVGLCCSAVLATGKFVIGFFTDYSLCSAAVYTFAILISKFECVLGIKSEKRSFKTRNNLVAASLLISSVFYIGFTFVFASFGRTDKEYSLVYVVALACISFAELGFAIYGIIRTKDKGHYYRNIKIINFCVAIIALLTTQMTILDFASKSDTIVYNSYSGIGVGCFIALCAVYIFTSPIITVNEREHNVFELKSADKNDLIDMQKPTAEIMLCKSRVYGSYVYRAEVRATNVDGNIERDTSLWKRLDLPLKILCCILSEILIFVWLIGRAVFFIRSMNLPKRLERMMTDAGFIKIECGPPAETASLSVDTKP